MEYELLSSHLRDRAKYILGPTAADGSRLKGKKYLDGSLRKIAIDGPVIGGMLPIATLASLALGGLVAFPYGEEPFVNVGTFFRVIDGVRDDEAIIITKVRTMVKGAQVDENKLIKESGFYSLGEWKSNYNDQRITGIGRVLRKTSLDEMPQVIDAARGRLTTIGPRYPSMSDTEEVNKRSSCEPFKTYRQAVESGEVKFGITGMYFVMGRSNLGFYDRFALESLYIKRASLPADLKILAYTLRELTKFSGR